jgi:alanyl-tRNA synthetase
MGLRSIAQQNIDLGRAEIALVDFDQFLAAGFVDADFIRSLADRLLDVETTAQAALVMGRAGDSGRVVVKTRRGANLSANDAFGRIRAAVGGKGGGNEVLAQGGGFRVTEFDRIVDALKTWIIENGEAKDQG